MGKSGRNPSRPVFGWSGHNLFSTEQSEKLKHWNGTEVSAADHVEASDVKTDESKTSLGNKKMQSTLDAIAGGVESLPDEITHTFGKAQVPHSPYANWVYFPLAIRACATFGLFITCFFVIARFMAFSNPPFFVAVVFSIIAVGAFLVCAGLCGWTRWATYKYKVKKGRIVANATNGAITAHMLSTTSPHNDTNPNGIGRALCNSASDIAQNRGANEKYSVVNSTRFVHTGHYLEAKRVFIDILFTELEIALNSITWTTLFSIMYWYTGVTDTDFNAHAGTSPTQQVLNSILITLAIISIYAHPGDALKHALAVLKTLTDEIGISSRQNIAKGDSERHQVPSAVDQHVVAGEHGGPDHNNYSPTQFGRGVFNGPPQGPFF